MTAAENISACAFAATPQSATSATATVVPVDATHLQVRTFVDATAGGTQGVPAARRRERAPDHHLLRQVNGIAGARGCAPAPTRP